MYCVATRNRNHHDKYTRHLQQLHFSKVLIQRNIRQYQGMMEDPFQKFHAIASRRRENMQEIAHHQGLTPALDTQSLQVGLTMT